MEIERGGLTSPLDVLRKWRNPDSSVIRGAFDPEVLKEQERERRALYGGGGANLRTSSLKSEGTMAAFYARHDAIAEQYRERKGPFERFDRSPEGDKAAERLFRQYLSELCGDNPKPRPSPVSRAINFVTSQWPSKRRAENSTFPTEDTDSSSRYVPHRSLFKRLFPWLR